MTGRWRWAAVCASTAPAASTASVAVAPRTLSKPVALAGHLHDGGVGEEAGGNRVGRGAVTEKPTPALRRLVYGGRRRDALHPVASGRKLVRLETEPIEPSQPCLAACPDGSLTC